MSTSKTHLRSQADQWVASVTHDWHLPASLFRSSPAFPEQTLRRHWLRIHMKPHPPVARRWLAESRVGFRASNKSGWMWQTAWSGYNFTVRAAHADKLSCFLFLFLFYPHECIKPRVYILKQFIINRPTIAKLKLPKMTWQFGLICLMFTSCDDKLSKTVIYTVLWRPLVDLA